MLSVTGFSMFRYNFLQIKTRWPQKVIGYLNYDLLNNYQNRQSKEDNLNGSREIPISKAYSLPIFY